MAMHDTYKANVFRCIDSIPGCMTKSAIAYQNMGVNMVKAQLTFMKRW